MSDDQRPWWASTDGGQTTTDDPVVAHRAARRGPSPRSERPQEPDVPSSRTQEAGESDATADGTAAADDGPSPFAEPSHDDADAVCGVCPICMLARTLGDTHPELLGHLTQAARHLAAAARAMLDPPAQRDTGPERVQRIDLD